MEWLSAISEWSHVVCKKTDGSRGCIKQNDPDSENTYFLSHVESRFKRGWGNENLGEMKRDEGKGTEEHIGGKFDKDALCVFEKVTMKLSLYN